MTSVAADHPVSARRARRVDRRAADEVAAQVSELYRAYQPQLLRFVRRLATERGLAEAQLDTEGVVHEAFALLLRYPGTIANPPGWLCTVARRLVGRAQARQRRIAAGEPVSYVDSATVRWSSLAPQACTEDLQAARAVMNAIAELPDRQRVATYLSHVEGWSRQEIGAYLDCAAATAAVHVHRGSRRVQARVSFLDGSRWAGLPTVVVAVLGGVAVVIRAIDSWIAAFNQASSPGIGDFFHGFVDDGPDPSSATPDASGLPFAWPTVQVIGGVCAGLLVLIWLGYTLQHRRRTRTVR